MSSLPDIAVLVKRYSSDPGFNKLPACPNGEWPVVPCLTCPGCRHCHYCRELRPANAQQTEHYCDKCRTRVRHGQPLTWA